MILWKETAIQKYSTALKIYLVNVHLNDVLYITWHIMVISFSGLIIGVNIDINSILRTDWIVLELSVSINLVFVLTAHPNNVLVCEQI